MPNFELEAKINAWTFFAPVIFGGLAAFILPRSGISGSVAIVLSVIGTRFIVTSKLSLKKRTNQIFEFGSKGMTDKEKRRYYVGCVMLLVAVVLITYQRLESIK